MANTPPAERRYRFGVVGFAHMHVNELVDRFLAHPQIEPVACADTVPTVPSRTDAPGSRRANLRRALEQAGIPRAYDDYREMLDAERLDIAVFCPENARHGEVAVALAEHGVHMVTEKPMAASLAEALQMARAAERAGVSLMVNWPITWAPAQRAVKQLLDDGAIGAIRQIRWRNRASLGPLAHGSVHPGSTVVSDPVDDAAKGAEWWHRRTDGGGALLDYCCYGACVACWYLGEPAVAAQGMVANLASHYGDAEDNAVVVARFASAMAVLEASWTTHHNGVANGPIIYGAGGTIVVDGDRALLYTERGASEPTRVVEGEPLPVGRATLAEELIHHLESGQPLHPTLSPALNLRAMAILDAGRRSAASGRLELVNDAHWHPL